MKNKTAKIEQKNKTYKVAMCRRTQKGIKKHGA
jgi:hypothetical protein